MKSLSLFINKINSKIATAGAFFILAMIFLTLSIVILRYVFGVGKVWLQELVIYFHASFFILGSAYTLLKDKHVRVDVFYQSFSEVKKAYTNLIGSLFLILPLSLFIFIKSLPYVSESFRVLESSTDSGGLPGKFILKGLIPFFCFIMFAQGVSMAITSFYFIKERKR